MRTIRFRARRSVAATAVAVVLAAALTACTSKSSAQSSAAASATQSAAAAAALNAVQQYWDYSIATGINPHSFDVQVAGKFAEAAALNALTQSANSFITLHQVAKGTPPKAHLKVTSDFSTDPTHPGVTVTNCPDPPGDFRLYDTTTGQPVPTPANAPSVAPQPWLATYTVAHEAGDLWLVGQVSTTSDKTCTA